MSEPELDVSSESDSDILSSPSSEWQDSLSGTLQDTPSTEVDFELKPLQKKAVQPTFERMDSGSSTDDPEGVRIFVDDVTDDPFSPEDSEVDSGDEDFKSSPESVPAELIAHQEVAVPSFDEKVCHYIAAEEPEPEEVESRNITSSPPAVAFCPRTALQLPVVHKLSATKTVESVAQIEHVEDVDAPSQAVEEDSTAPVPVVVVTRD